MKYYIKYILQKLIALCLLPFHLLPIRPNRILFLSLEGGSTWEYSCNPRAFCEYLLTEAPGDYEIVWLFREPEKYQFLREKGIRMVRHFTPRGLAYALTSHIVITNGGYLTWFPFRRGQICINTWHGSGAYKRLENDMAGANRASRKRMEYSARHTAAFISGCEAFSRLVIRGAFLYDGEILPIGMPRNDVFFSPACDERYNRVREELGLPANCRLALYTPTFRPSGTLQEALPSQALLDRLRERTGENWRLLYRTHIQAADTTNTVRENNWIRNVTSYPETQDLLCAADLLITDYSSILWDYSLTGRPILLFTPDLEEYTAKRGFYYKIQDWGFPLCRDARELLEALDETLSKTTSDASAHHQALLGSYETGQACEKLLHFVRQA
ncbi:MAG: CDP-glycerol glycerophosphotransferase family protein [Lachnospiraceae bacterium]|nr:CDP-glycerol glycerophosphotransferase family protein [Lachnospiraceae bacterium]